MKWGRTFGIFGALLILVLMGGLARGEVISQSFTLQAGWNAIFLEVEPEPTAPADVFSGVTGLQSVWMWNPRTGTVEFIQNPDEMVADQPQWLVYYPGNPVATNLHAIHGNTAYLINYSGSTSTTLTISGEPLIPMPDWKANSFNFVGFHLEQGNEPYFQDFFSSDPALASEDIYILNNSTGTWDKLTSPATTSMKRGEAFWIYCNGSSTFTGPLSVQPEQSDGLIYGKQLSELDIMVNNNAASDKTVTLSLSGLTGNMYYWTYVQADGFAKWVPFPTPLSLSIPAGSFQKLRLGIKRAGLTADAVYSANLTVRDGDGMSILVPVSVTGIDYAGLWVGYATINKVNEPLSDPNTPVSTGSQFSFRIIVHVDDGGQAKLLNEVIQMWQEGTWKPDPNDLGKLIVDQPGHFVLLANNGLIANYSGAALRDGQPVGRRISAPAFPRITPSERILGAFDPSSGQTLTTTITLAADDPTNPFRHLYHPDHKVPDQSYQVIRDITMTFSDVDSDGRPIPGIFEMTQGSTQIGGIYEETITGLHRDPLRIKGTFVLHKVSSVGTLIE